MNKFKVATDFTLCSLAMWFRNVKRILTSRLRYWNINMSLFGGEKLRDKYRDRLHEVHLEFNEKYNEVER